MERETLICIPAYILQAADNRRSRVKISRYEKRWHFAILGEGVGIFAVHVGLVKSWAVNRRV